MIIKSADISNVGLPFSVARHWVYRVADEFYAQGDCEKAKGLTPPPFMDRSVSTPPKITSDFGRFVARPLFEILRKIVPSTTVIVDYIDVNLEALERLQEGIDDDWQTDFEVHPDHQLDNDQNNEELNSADTVDSPLKKSMLIGTALLER